MMEKGQRIQSIDAIRGVCIIIMVFYHFLYDLVFYLDLPTWILLNPVLDVVQTTVAFTFICLSGVSSRFSRSNVKRGIRVLAVAMVITVVTVFVDNPILFGVLHLLGFCMVFYGLTRKLWDAIPEKIAPVIYALLFVTGIIVKSVYNPVKILWLWILGFYSMDFYSSDYFPLLPWVFVFLLGTWLGKITIEKRLPEKFYTVNLPILPQIGRNSLIIYILHQPVIYGLTMLIGIIMDTLS